MSTTDERVRVLNFGLQPRHVEDMWAVWGGRGIWTPGSSIDIPGDRQDVAGPDHAIQALAQWVDREALPAIRKVIDACDLRQDDDREVMFVSSPSSLMRLYANPKRPFGYLHLGACYEKHPIAASPWRVDEGCAPSRIILHAKGWGVTREWITHTQVLLRGHAPSNEHGHYFIERSKALDDYCERVKRHSQSGKIATIAGIDSLSVSSSCSTDSREVQS